MAEREGRRYLPVRVSWAGYRMLKERAREECDGNVSELVRRMLKYASVHMPKGWAG